MKRYKLHLEDHGQDFLWFVVEGGRVIDAGPFQAKLWVGKLATRTRFAPGDTIFLKDTGGQSVYSLRYPVVRVDVLSWAEPTFAKKLALRDAAEAGGLLHAQGTPYACLPLAGKSKPYASNTIRSLWLAGFLKRERIGGTVTYRCTPAGYDALPWGWRPEMPKLAEAGRAA